MTVSAEDLRRMARLAELDLAAAEVDHLTRQLDAIVAYVGQLAALDPETPPAPLAVGPPAAPLRPDAVQPTPLAEPLSAFAPDLRDGFFVVPRLSAMEEE